MPEIKVLNNKQELFCRFVARGETYTKAYELAGYAPSTSNASGLANRPDIADRIKHLREEHLREQALFEAHMAGARRDDRDAGGGTVAQRQTVEWTFNRVMDMIADNVRLAQIAQQFGAANDALKMLGDAMSMFDKAAAAKVPPANPLAFVGKLVNQLPGPDSDEDDAPAPPRNPLAPAAD